MTDTNVSFVRHEQIPPSPPPARETGVIKWARENLFSNWFNTILSLIAFYVIIRVILGAAPWFINGVWDAGSIRECRDILAAAGKETGACFAVLVDRWDHLLFGFQYPADAYWRPTLAFLLLLVAAVPALFYMYVPRKYLLFTAAYPFLAFWLRFVLPWRMGEQRYTHPAPTREHYAHSIRPKISLYLESVMPRVAQQHMQHDAIETLGANARECGSLWGPQYELPVAGILASGAAFYGKCFWRSPASEEHPLAELDSEIRETRYGFGRERRLRLCFTGRAAPTWLRRQVARRSDAQLIDAGALLGE